MVNGIEPGGQAAGFGVARQRRILPSSAKPLQGFWWEVWPVRRLTG